MDEESDFLKALAILQAAIDEEIALKQARSLAKAQVPIKIDLTTTQKRIVVNYVLSGPGKGLFEDIPEFWEKIENIDHAYPSLRDAVDEYVASLKDRLLAEL